MLFSALLLLAGMAFAQEDYGAKDVWNKVREHFGSKELIQKNASEPLNTSKPMKSISGETFDARIRCASGKEAIKVLFMPASGNDYYLLVEQDLDLDGAYEYSYTTNPVNVSGVCHGGVVKCDPGSWTNCSFYRWSANSNGYVSLRKANSIKEVGNCICTNESCGVKEITQEHLNYIAGGIAQAVMSVKSELGISRGSFGNFLLTLSVQDKNSCSYAGVTTVGESSPTEYYNTQTAPDVSSYLTDPAVTSSEDSPYYLVSRASEVKIEGRNIGYPSITSCDVRKQVFLTTTDLYENCPDTYTDPGGEVWCIDGTLRMNRGCASLCGGNVCDKGDRSVQGGEIYLCGSLQTGARLDDNWCEDGDFCLYYFRCRPGDTYCEEMQSLIRSGIRDCDPYDYQCQRRSGRYVTWWQTVFMLRYKGDDGCPDDFCTYYYDVYCRKPAELSVTLKRAQKWGLLVTIGGNNGWEDGYWNIMSFKDGSLNEVISRGDYRTCNPRRQFYAFGSARDDGEVHTVGAIHIAQSWTKRCGFLSCWFTPYPPKWMEVSVIKSRRYLGDSIQLTETSTCNVDSSCRLRNEWICDEKGENCVQRIKNGLDTGAVVYPFCYTASTNLDSYVVCAKGNSIEVKGGRGLYERTFTGSDMWFWIKREYECSADRLGIDLTRAEKVIENTTESNGQVVVQDFVCENGVCTPTDTYSAQIPEKSSCPVPLCTVRTLSKDTSVFADRSNRSQLPSGGEGSVLEVRSCSTEGGNPECPVRPGEQIVEDCSCVEGIDTAGFSTAVTTLQVIVESVRDMICSTVAP